MNLTNLFTLLFSTIFALAFVPIEKRNELGIPSTPIIAHVDGLNTVSGADTFYNPESDMNALEPHKRFELIHDRILRRSRGLDQLTQTESVPAAEEHSTYQDSNSELIGNENSPTEQEKSSVGNVVKNVEKKWVKIVEIALPIAIGIPLLIIIGITCFVCCFSRRIRREARA